MRYKIRPKVSTKVGAIDKSVLAARKLNFSKGRGNVIELQPRSNIIFIIMSLKRLQVCLLS